MQPRSPPRPLPRSNNSCTTHAAASYARLAAQLRHLRGWSEGCGPEEDEHATAAPAAQPWRCGGRCGRRPDRYADVRVSGGFTESCQSGHRTAHPSPEDPVQPAQRGCHRDQRIPGRWPRASSPACGVRECHQQHQLTDRGGCSGTTGRRGRPGRAQPAGCQLCGDSRTGPRQQSAGATGRRPVSAQCKRPAAKRRFADRGQPRKC